MTGGDYAPRVTVDGFKIAIEDLPKDTEYVLFGEKEITDPLSVNYNGRVTSVHTSGQIEMGDEPTKAFGSKKDSSIVKGFEYLSKGNIDVFCSAGNSGAMLVGATAVIGVIKGVIRPSITIPIPRENGKDAVLLDAGLNPECKAENLLQFGLMGSLYAQHVIHIKEPTVGLLNIGSEENKGSLLYKSTFNLMKESKRFSFVGNVEGYDLFTDRCPDVIVCDGFVGNIILKYTEGIYSLLKRKNITDSFVENFNFETYGGTPILGINKNVSIGHGMSTAVAIKSMIINSWHVAESQINKVFINTFEYEKI